MPSINAAYLKSIQTTIKILQIILGIFTSITLCSFNYGKDKTCFDDSRIACAFVLNVVALAINVTIFALNIAGFVFDKIYEYIYSYFFAMLFGLASIFTLGYMADEKNYHAVIISSTVSLFIQMLLFIWDVIYLQRSNPDIHRAVEDTMSSSTLTRVLAATHHYGVP